MHTLSVQESRKESCMQDEALTAEMLRLAEPGGRLTMSTAYLNLARPFERALASASKVCRFGIGSCHGQ